MLAMAERAWKGGGTEYFDKNGTILPTDEHSELFRSFADFERRLLWHKEHTFDGYPFAYVRQTNVKWNITDAFPNEGNLAKAFPPEETLQDSYSYGGKTYNVRPAIGAGIYLRHVWGRLFPDFIKNRKKTIRPTPTPMSIRRKNKTLVCGLNFRITDAPKPIFLLCRENGIIRKAVSG